MSRDTHAGRYAPSPSGPLHLGSLLAAVGSYLQARAQDASWRLRIDDVDTPRVVAGAAAAICDTLRVFGLRWDGPVVYQSARRSAYAAAIARLQAGGAAFDCGCTRREAQAGITGLEGRIYPGTCRGGLAPGRSPRSVRIRVDDRPIEFVDQVQGVYRQTLSRDIGDFVISRADGVTAYQLATVVDDAACGAGEIVRGADLLSSTPRQILLQQRLGLARPAYAHLPVLVDAHGEKLGKSNGALALDRVSPGLQLWRCLALLGQQPPNRLREAAPARLLRWGCDNWSLEKVPSIMALPG